MTARTKNLGNAGEVFAANFLEQNGYKILARNFRLKFAEIDIIAEFEGTIIFVEVKTRSGVNHGLPAESVNFRKQQKIIKAASIFMQKDIYCNYACRFDIVEVYSDGVKFSARHIPNAFEVVSEF